MFGHNSTQGDSEIELYLPIILAHVTAVNADWYKCVVPATQIPVMALPLGTWISTIVKNSWQNFEWGKKDQLLLIYMVDLFLKNSLYYWITVQKIVKPACEKLGFYVRKLYTEFFTCECLWITQAFYGMLNSSLYKIILLTAEYPMLELLGTEWRN